MMHGKFVSDSAIHDQTAVVFPNDLNAYGTLFGGRVIDLCDSVTGVVAKRHAGKVCVTLAIDSVRFLTPAKQGDILVFKAAINKVWKTSMEIGIKVYKEECKSQRQIHIVSAYFTFVALDDDLNPVEILPIIPQTEEEQRRYEEAEERRQLRLKK